MRARLAAAAVALYSALACVAPATAGETSGVVVTIKPVHALVSQLMHGLGEPALLVRGQASPHSFSLKPSDIEALGKARLFFRVSEQVEPFTIKLVAALPPQVRTITLADAEGVTHLTRRTGDTFEEDVHTEEPSTAEAPHAGAVDHGEDEHEREHAAYDGHVWLDPQNAKAMVAAIARELTGVYPDKAPVIAANRAAAEARLDALTASLGKSLKLLKDKPFAVFHDAYQYFERRFGLQVAAAITLSPEAHPSARRLSEIRAKIMAGGVACVFAEPGFSPKLVDAVLEGTQARSGTLDPEGLTIDAGSAAYDTLLLNLGRGLLTCLTPH